MVSMNSRIVSGLRIVHEQSANSPTVRSALVADGDDLEKPTPRPSPRESSPPVMLPDWDTIASGPGVISSCSMAAFTESAHEARC